ncbi:MAG: hypothetical protein ACPG77_17045, partial [Nannocystaceae bacterium]
MPRQRTNGDRPSEPTQAVTRLKSEPPGVEEPETRNWTEAAKTKVHGTPNATRETTQQRRKDIGTDATRLRSGGDSPTNAPLGTGATQLSEAA